MNLLIKFCLIFCTVSITSLWAISEGVEYENLNKQLDGETNSVIKAFSYTCIHCYNHHKLNTLGKVKEKLPNLEYKIYPVKSFTFGEEFAQVYAYAQFQDEKNKISFTDKNALTQRVADAYFTAYFERKQRYSNSDDFLKLGLLVLKINKTQLNNFLQSKDGKLIYSSYDKASVLSAQYGGTPAFAVAGKYLLRMENIKSLEHLIEVVKALSSK